MDLDTLIQARIHVLRAANLLSEDVDMREIAEQSRVYYQNALPTETHTAYLVYDEDKLVGTGGISYYQVMPTYHNPKGKKAYIMNMYTDPAYRRQGIAFHVLECLIEDAWSKGVTAVSLEATEMGRPLYEKFGFVQMQTEMELPEGFVAKNRECTSPQALLKDVEK